jgi:ferric-dicitrate binding protein FerR (iron transport regulator)
MSATELSRFDELVSRYLDDALTDSDAAALVASLAEPPLAARFLEMTRLNSEIAGVLAAPVPDAAMVELVRTDIEKHLRATQPEHGLRLKVVERTYPATSSPPPVHTPIPLPRRRAPVLRALAWAAVFLVFASLAAVWFVNRGPTAEAASVASVQGEVRLVGNAGERQLKAGQSWSRGETLKTVGAKSAVTVTFSDGTRLDFGGDSVAVNRSGQQGRRVELEHGELQSVVKKQPPRQPFVFTTPEAEAVVAGTTLRLVTGAHHTRLEVTEGGVRFRRLRDGAEVTVKTGYGAVVAPNAPLVATPFHPDPHALR